MVTMPYPNISMFLLCTGLVILAAGIIIPIWVKVDPLFNILLKLGLKKSLGIGGADKLFTKEELSAFKASSNSGRIYLGILGKVYDVTAGKTHYGIDGSYSFFTGIDGSRAFVTGDFNKVGLIDDIEGLTEQECLSLSEWVKFYSDEYKYVGKVIGNFYDDNGKETSAIRDFHEKVERALKQKEIDDKEKNVFPECNSRWSKEEGTVVWCSNESGGVKREWAGVPRMFFKPGQNDYRCACIEKKHLGDSRLKQYPNCNADSVSCEVK